MSGPTMLPVKISAKSHRLVPFVAMIVVVANTFLSPLAMQATSGTCQDDPPNYTWASVERNPSAGYVNGIKASIHTGGGNPHFWACSGTTVGNDAAIGFVNIQPVVYDPNSIIQVGVVRCTHTFSFACTNEVPHFTWAHGGCGFPFPDQPVLEDLGETTYVGTHSYEIVFSNGLWRFKIDGVQKASLNPASDSINCWINDDRKALWFAERHDRGDSVGSNGTTSQRMQFTAMRYKYNATAYIAISVSSCNNTDSAGAGRYICASGGSDWLHVWNMNP